jgi:hypothetical protein
MPSIIPQKMSPEEMENTIQKHLILQLLKREEKGSVTVREQLLLEQLYLELKQRNPDLALSTLKATSEFIKQNSKKTPTAEPEQRRKSSLQSSCTNNTCSIKNKTIKPKSDKRSVSMAPQRSQKSIENDEIFKQQKETLEMLSKEYLKPKVKVRSSKSVSRQQQQHPTPTPIQIQTPVLNDEKVKKKSTSTKRHKSSRRSDV